MPHIYLTGSNEKVYGITDGIDMSGLALKENWAIEMHTKGKNLNFKTIKNPNTKDFENGSKGKSCQITM